MSVASIYSHCIGLVFATADENSEGSDLLLTYVVVGGVILIIVALSIWLIPKWQLRSLDGKSIGSGDSEFSREKDRIQLEDDLRKTIAQAVGGVFLIIGLFFSYHTYRLGVEQQKLNGDQEKLNARGQVTERFNKVVDHLGQKENLTVRLGGLYALEQVLKDSPDDHGNIIEVISLYIRNNAGNPERRVKEKSWAEKLKTPFEDVNMPGIDVQAAMTIMGRRPSGKNRSEVTFDLSDTNLSNVDVSESELGKVASFRKIILNGADLTNTDFSSDDLTGADLGDSFCFYAHFDHSILAGVDFQRAELLHAELDGAELGGARNLTAEALDRADFDSVYINGQQMTRDDALQYFRTHQPTDKNDETAQN